MAAKTEPAGCLEKEGLFNLTGDQTYDRQVGICYLNGEGIGRSLIAAGLARDCPKYSGGMYQSAEKAGNVREKLKEYKLPGYC